MSVSIRPATWNVVLLAVLLTMLAVGRTANGAAAIADPTVRVAVLELPPVVTGGTWTIGGRTYRTTPDTRIDGGDAPFVAGRLVRVEWIGGDDGPVATRISGLAVAASEVCDGPYVFHRSDGRVEVVRVVGEDVRRAILEVPEGGLELEAPGVPGGTVRVSATPPIAAPARVSIPGRLMAISDLEGNLEAARGLLAAHGVVDADGAWSWGDGHLVLVGDSVDRGMRVTELLWWIRALEAEATAAGGGVHLLLGNHEEMVLGGDLRYIHPVYAYTAERIGRSYDALYGPDTELGRWLRSRASVLVAGDLLFVHAGYSPALDALDLDPDAVNRRVRAGLGPEARQRGTELADRIGRDRMGPLWYRGHHARYAESWGGRPTVSEIDAILSRHGADAMVIGHTLVPDAGWLDGDRRILSVDVRWAQAGEAEGLLVVDGSLFIVDGVGGRRSLPAPGRQIGSP